VGLSKKSEKAEFIPQERALSCAHSNWRRMRWFGGTISVTQFARSRRQPAALAARHFHEHC